MSGVQYADLFRNVYSTSWASHWIIYSADSFKVTDLFSCLYEWLIWIIHSSQFTQKHWFIWVKLRLDVIHVIVDFALALFRAGCVKCRLAILCLKCYWVLTSCLRVIVILLNYESLIDDISAMTINQPIFSLKIADMMLDVRACKVQTEYKNTFSVFIWTVNFV